MLPRPLRTENCTSAVLFRLVDKHCPTLLLDEVDTYLPAHDELRGLLNAGHRRGAKALRCEGDNYDIRAFNAFAPVVLAGIGSLPGTLHDRSILVPLVRAKPGEIAHRFDSRKIAKETELKTKLNRWSIDHTEELNNSDPVLPESAHNRLADNWRPLVAIAEAVGGSWREKVRLSFEHMNSDTQAEEAQGIGTTLLADIRDLFDEIGSGKLFSATITDKLIALEGRPWPEYRRGKPLSKNQLARLLGRFGIKSTSLRIGSDIAKGYNLAAFSEAFERFLPPSQESLPKRHNVTNLENKGDSDTSETSQISSNPEQSRCETLHEKSVLRLETSHSKPVTFGDSTDLFNFPKEKSTCNVVTVGEGNSAKETTDGENDVTYV
jgi:putative DNA primase/helicase